MSKNRVVNQIYSRKALWLVPSTTLPNDPLRRASPGIQPLAAASPHPPLHILYFSILCCTANSSHFLKSTLLCCEMHLQSGHDGISTKFVKIIFQKKISVIMLWRCAFPLWLIKCDQACVSCSRLSRSAPCVYFFFIRALSQQQCSLFYINNCNVFFKTSDTNR